MKFTRQDVEANRDFLAARLRTIQPMGDVEEWVKAAPSDDDFVLLDVRSRASFSRGHIPGAMSVPLADLDLLSRRLPADRELVTYCGGGT
jgi:rhodanese-related sulfurtransferase